MSRDIAADSLQTDVASEEVVGGTAADEQDTEKKDSTPAPPDDESSKPAEPKNEEKESSSWTESVCPLCSISGRSNINAKTLQIAGLPSGGFSSVGTKGILLTSGKWYYEAELITAGCLQIGWADGSFAGHCQADRGDGCSDRPSSWAFDGWRRYRWHSAATEWGCRWQVRDVCGCAVDMDEKVVSFTLNGRGEEIGMGVAFSGEGFRPCGGVYACVSFNRKEKLRLFLGGAGSPFRYGPPDGYRGVSHAIMDAVKERAKIVEDERLLAMPRRISTSNASELPKFTCDFSDGEHGHELFAWQHRYYGSDASVHLGKGNSSGRGSKETPSSGVDSVSTQSSIDEKVRHSWKKTNLPSRSEDPDECNTDFTFSDILVSMNKGYMDAERQLNHELHDISLALGIQYSRKLILHILLTLSHEFDLSYFIHPSQDSTHAARNLWLVLDICCSLRSAGWVGEAGAMAIAAEALGLGISSHDTGGSTGGKLSAGGLTQMLTSVMECPDSNSSRGTCDTFAASAEAAIGGEGGGALVFLRDGLQSAVGRSEVMQNVMVAAVRRSVRLLAAVDYSRDVSSAENDEGEGSTETKDSQTSKDDEFSVGAPDARLSSFFTGLLLSHPVQNILHSNEQKEKIHNGLFEAWSIGLLSASAPWRMVCSLSASCVLNRCHSAVWRCTERLPTLRRFYARLQNTVMRRVWAERAAFPVCSRYVQSLIELLSIVKRTGWLDEHGIGTTVDAATPLPLLQSLQSRTAEEDKSSSHRFWEWDEGWSCSDMGWEVWTGTVECMEVEWKAPSGSAVRTLMDGGQGPPMLREDCVVMRGLDWDEEGSGSVTGNEDGKDIYEKEKVSREKEKLLSEEGGEQEPPAESEKEKACPDEEHVESEAKSADKPSSESDSASKKVSEPSESDQQPKTPSQRKKGEKKKKKKKIPNPMLPIGTVLSIEPWNGIPAAGRRVRWHLTGTEGVYRYGGDGGRYDLAHVEVNEKETRVRKRHPLPESAEQCAARHGFGVARKYNVILRLRRQSTENVDENIECIREGLLEWPDFGAGIHVECIFHDDGAITITEKELVFGSKDCGWEARFGEPSYVPGSVVVLCPTGSSGAFPPAEFTTRFEEMNTSISQYDELLGSSSFLVKNLSNRQDGGRLRVTSEMRLFRDKSRSSTKSEKQSASHLITSAPMPPPIHFDPDFHASSISLSRDGRTVTCTTSEGRGTAFASAGFSKGVHYWEVKIEQADIGSVFIGVAEKPGGASATSGGASFSFDAPPRLNRWHGWGFVNFRATYTAGAERVYGAHCHAGDTVGVLLDCDAGRISFFFDGVKYGEHIMNDLGCAFENVSPFGFNADGCGSGGSGQGAPSGIEGGRVGRYPANGAVRPRSLWPVVGLRSKGDRVTFGSKWMTGIGVDGKTVLQNALATDEVLCRYEESIKEKDLHSDTLDLPKWFIRESFLEYERWRSDRWIRSSTRGSGPHPLGSIGLDVYLDTSPIACACACASLGLTYVLLSGDRVAVKRSAGRMLELSEEALVLGTYQGRLFYRIVSQKSEGGSLTEGGGRAWFWDESEVVDGGIELVAKGKGLDVELPLLERFKCPSSGGLKIVYAGGAVIRSDLEIFDGSTNIGMVPHATTIPRKDVLERRMNSAGVVRYRIRHQGSQGWISSRIRGGKEEAIVEPVSFVKSETADDNSQGESDATDVATKRFFLPQEAAREWHEKYMESFDHTQQRNFSNDSYWEIKSVDEFENFIKSAKFPELSYFESDSILASAVSAAADFSVGGDAVDCHFSEVAPALSFALTTHGKELKTEERFSGEVAGSCQATAAVMSGLRDRNLPSVKALLARVAMLRALNRRARLALPWLSLRSAQESSAILGGLVGFGASINRAGREQDATESSKWLRVNSIASRLRDFRHLFFLSIKRTFLDSMMEATTTPTPLSHDEYELPREVRTVRVNRLKARKIMASDDKASKRKFSAFAQLQHEMRGWSGAALRRSHVAKGHGGQKRAFKVKLIGEGVNDYSGPYREVFTDAIREMTEIDKNHRSDLGILEPSPNNSNNIGEERDYYTFSLGSAAATSKESLFQVDNCDTLTEEEKYLIERFSVALVRNDEPIREVEDALVFLGRLVGTACRHGIPVDLPLPLMTVWKKVAEEKVGLIEALNEIDLLASRQLEQDDIGNDYRGKGHSSLLISQQRMLNFFTEGVSGVLPAEILSIFTGKQLRDVICGNPDVDVDLLRSVVEYEGYNGDDQVIRYFWETLREMTNDERKLFLQFVWARSRLPIKASDFDAPFKIMRDTKSLGADADALPSASTCFFSLSLPEYQSKEMLCKKLKFAIENVTTMESDYVTNDAEVSEGWRGL